MLKEHTHLPVIVDPSHAAGRRDLVGPLSSRRRRPAQRGDVEVHPRPDEALSDGAQALTTAEFANYAYELRALAQAIQGVPAAA